MTENMEHSERLSISANRRNQNNPTSNLVDSVFCVVCGLEASAETELRCSRCHSLFHRHCVDPNQLNVLSLRDWICSSCAFASITTPYASNSVRVKGEGNHYDSDISIAQRMTGEMITASLKTEDTSTQTQSSQAPMLDDAFAGLGTDLTTPTTNTNPKRTLDYPHSVLQTLGCQNAFSTFNTLIQNNSKSHARGSLTFLFNSAANVLTVTMINNVKC